MYIGFEVFGVLVLVFGFVMGPQGTGVQIAGGVIVGAALIADAISKRGK
jgi:hypothetical protein